LYTYSEVFSNSIWANGNATITDNTITAPNGTLTADSIFEQAANDYQIRGQNYSMVSGQQFTFSIYAKANTRNFFRILVGNGVLTSNQSAYFDLINVTTTSTSLITSSITSVGNGWCKIVISFTCNATASDAIYYGPSPNMTSGYLPFVGNASNGVYAWGAQLNIGSTAKPYFPTTDRLNVPRLTYQNGGGGCPSLLLEKQSTNLILQSNTFNTTWAMFTGPAVTPNTTTSPDGTTSATTLNSSGGTNDFLYQTLSGLTVGATYSFSFYIKNLNSTASRFWGPSGSSIVDLSWSGSTLVSISGTGASFTSVGNDWYRVVQTGTTPTATPTMRIYADVNNTSKSVYIYGAQLEASTYPTSYIPTTSASATRVADACFKTGISSLIGQTEGTMFLDFVFKPQANNTDGQIGISDGANSNRVILWNNFTLNTLGLQLRANGTNQISNVSLGSFVDNTRYKIAVAYKSGNTSVFVNGIEVIANTATFTFSSAITNFILGGYELTYSGHQQVNESVLFKTRLTNAELASLTTI
jgi:hypothetical protein